MQARATTCSNGKLVIHNMSDLNGYKPDKDTSYDEI